MSRIASGDGEAFARIFEMHSPVTLGLLVRILGRRSEAEEVLQEVFLQVWNQAGRYEAGRSTPRGWILMLARSRALLTVGDAADGLYHEAAEQLAGTTMATELARTHLLHGEWLRRRKRRTEARTSLRRAHDAAG